MRNAAPAPCAPPPPPSAKCMSAPKEMSKKRSSILGGLGRMFKSEEVSDAPEEKKPAVSASERKAFEKAVGALQDALAAARSELSAGKIPAVGPVDKARKALMQLLGGSVLGTTLTALQKLLRTGLLELVAALAAAGPAEVPALASTLDRCVRDLNDAVKPSEPKFWEKMV